MADLPLLPQEGESLDLKSGRFRNKKTGRYSRRVDVEAIVATIKDALTHIITVDKGMDAAVKKAELIQTDFRELTAALLPTAEDPKDAHKKALRKATSESKAAIKSAGMDILGLVGLLAVLKNDKLMSIVGGFFKGFLKSIGMSDRAIAKLFLGVKLAVAAFKLYLGYKVFKNVLAAFNALKNLGQVLGILTEKNNVMSSKFSIREAFIKGKEALLKGLTKTVQFFKSAYTKVKTIAKSFYKTITSWKRITQTVRIFYKKTIKAIKLVYGKVITKFKTFKTLVFSGLKLAIKGVRVAKVVAGAATFGIGYIVGGLVEAGLSTALDYWISKEMGEGTPDGSELVGMFLKNFVEGITLGLVNGDKLKSIATDMAKKFFSWFNSDTPEQKAKREKNVAEVTSKSTPQGPTPEKVASEFPAGLSKEQFNDQYDKKYISLRAAMAPDVIKTAEKRRDTVWTIYQKKNSKPVEKVSAVPATLAAANATPAGAPAAPAGKPAASALAAAGPSATPAAAPAAAPAGKPTATGLASAPAGAAAAAPAQGSGTEASMGNPFAGIPSDASADNSVNNPAS